MDMMRDIVGGNMESMAAPTNLNVDEIRMEKAGGDGAAESREEEDSLFGGDPDMSGHPEGDEIVHQMTLEELRKVPNMPDKETEPEAYELLMRKVAGVTGQRMICKFTPEEEARLPNPYEDYAAWGEAVSQVMIARIRGVPAAAEAPAPPTYEELNSLPPELADTGANQDPRHGMAEGDNAARVEQTLDERDVFRRIAKHYSDPKLAQIKRRYQLGSDEYNEHMFEFKKDALKVFVHKFFNSTDVSRPNRLGREWFASLDHQWVQRDFVLRRPPTHAQAANFTPSLYANLKILLHLDWKEMSMPGSLTQFHEVLQTARLAVFRTTLGKRLYILLHGPPSTGKSYLLKMVEELCFEGVTTKQTYATDKASLASTNRDYQIDVAEEMSFKDMGLDPSGKASMGDPVTKNQMTDPITSVAHMVTDEGVRRVLTSVSSKMSTRFGATNETLPTKTPTIARNVVMHVGHDHATEDPITKKQNRLRSEQHTARYKRLRRDHRLMCFYQFVVERAIQAHVIADVNMDTYIVYADRFFDELERKFGYDTNNPKMREDIKIMARTRVIQYAVYVALFSELGRDFRVDENGASRRFRDVPECLLQVEQYLVCTKEIAIDILTLMSFMYADSIQTEMLQCMNQYLSTDSARRDRDPDVFAFRPHPENEHAFLEPLVYHEASFVRMPTASGKSGIDGVVNWFMERLKMKPNHMDVRRAVLNMMQTMATVPRCVLGANGAIDLDPAALETVTMVGVGSGFAKGLWHVDEVAIRQHALGGGDMSNLPLPRRTGANSRRRTLRDEHELFVSTACVKMHCNPREAMVKVIQDMGHRAQLQDVEWVITSFPETIAKPSGARRPVYHVPRAVAIPLQDKHFFFQQPHHVSTSFLKYDQTMTEGRAMRDETLPSVTNMSSVLHVTEDLDITNPSVHLADTGIAFTNTLLNQPVRTMEAVQDLQRRRAVLYERSRNALLFPDDLLQDATDTQAERDAARIATANGGAIDEQFAEEMFTPNTDTRRTALGTSHNNVQFPSVLVERLERRKRRYVQINDTGDIDGYEDRDVPRTLMEMLNTSRSVGALPIRPAAPPANDADQLSENSRKRLRVVDTSHDFLVPDAASAASMGTTSGIDRLPPALTDDAPGVMLSAGVGSALEQRKDALDRAMRTRRSTFHRMRQRRQQDHDQQLAALDLTPRSIAAALDYE